MRRRSRRVIFLVAAVSLFLFSGIAQAQESRKKLTTAYSAISGAMIAPWIANEEGIFKKNGLDANLVYVSSGSKSLAAILSGQTPITLASGQALVQARLQGADLVSIADHTYTFVFSLITKPQIKKPEDLRGKKLGVVNFGGSTHMALVKALEYFRLRPVQDVAVIPVGGIPEILTAILSSGLDGGILSPPMNIKAEKLGLNELLDLGTLDIPFQQTTVITTESYSRSNPDIVRAYVKSFVDAVHLGKTNKVVAKRILSKYTKVNDDAILESTYELFVVKYLKRIPYPSDKAVKTVLDEIAEKNPRAGTANPKGFVDIRWVQELDNSGYIANLYKK